MLVAATLFGRRLLTSTTTTMKLSAAAAFLCFTTQLTLSNAFTTSSLKVSASRAISSSSSSNSPLFVATEATPESKTDEAVESEFAAVKDATIGALSKAIPDPKLLAPLSHFVGEYFSANEAAFKATKNPRCTPKETAERISASVQFGLKYGMGENKYRFGVSHEAMRGDGKQGEDDTLDYYEFGCGFFRPVMDLENSVVLGEDNLKKAFEQIKNGDNVVFFANHQSEADPQVFSCLLEKIGLGEEASHVYYVAGHKVTTDPLAIPFSMGRNLICIHSKKHINADKDTKALKQKQNLRSMTAMLKKMKAPEGEPGCVLWVAPSGGRDRRNVETNEVPIAPYDSKTIDMFRLMGNKAGKPIHYYPLGMVSYELCPPPDFIEAGVGEQRNIRFVPVGIACGDELQSTGGVESRKDFCDLAEKTTDEGYQQLLKEIN